MQPEQPVADDGQGLPASQRTGSGEDLDSGVAALRAQGAHQVDPVRFAFLEALARRMRGRQGLLRRLLARRLAQGVAAYRAHADTMGLDRDTQHVDRDTQHPGQSHQPLQALCDTHRGPTDSGAETMRGRPVRLGLEPAGSPLAELVRLMDGPIASDGQPIASAPVVGTRPAVVASTDNETLRELRTAHRFRATWTRLRIDAQLSRSRKQAPQNPGPLNSHLLVLRASSQMRELAPAYLEGLMAHVDALSWLDGAQGPKPTRPASAASRSRRKGKGEAAAD